MDAKPLTITLTVSGMDCADCARTVQSGVLQLDGVDACAVSFATERAQIVGNVNRDAVVRRVRELGYDVVDETDAAVPETPRNFLAFLWHRTDTRLALIAALLIGPIVADVEALACGAPVICSNTSSMREIAGALVPTFDPADSSAILTCMKTTLFRGWGDEARRRGMEYASGFDWRQTARRVIEVYRSVL